MTTRLLPLLWTVACADTGLDCQSPPSWYADRDGDRYGDPLDAVDACDAPSGYLGNAEDCDDSDASVHPGAPDGCNTRDDDCDGEVDEEPDVL